MLAMTSDELAHYFTCEFHWQQCPSGDRLEEHSGLRGVLYCMDYILAGCQYGLTENLLVKDQTIQRAEPRRDATFVAILALCPQQVSTSFVVQDLWLLLTCKAHPSVPGSSESDSDVLQPRGSFPSPPQTGAENAELADHVAADDAAVGAEDGVFGVRRGLDQLHEDVAGVGGRGDRLEEGGDRGAVDVVAATFALGFQDVVDGCRGVRG
jgi:hypothetical protein